ncbi:DEAD/DEAH box helicase [Breoghania sp. L-A4]|uniref:DEAD/DEAH box helicase n=1 Tax=Breoghania sp. L-A4 TaxID=2304600 RepID=UPI000E35F6C2|nr:DEAD/DEAH box helicase [Breoghania sp. L-A4]AXS41184.1 DEAD/DEAH box helicase [Breoghania sp. L-A4]
MTQFTDLGLGAPILKALADEKYETPTPIQAQSIPLLLKGHDLLGVAQTGTGKTAAFGLPLIQMLSEDTRPLQPKTTRALILSPTRELAQQINDSLKTYSRHVRLRTAVVVGGVSIRSQIRALERGTDILVATPGRLLDLINNRAVRLDELTHFVLDEADQMLDLGFIHDLKRLVKMLPPKRQSLFFSATMPKTIADLASAFLTNPEKVSVAPVASTAEKIDQRVIFTQTPEKMQQLSGLLKGDGVSRAIVFTRTKHGADKVVRDLGRNGIEAAAIHGNKSQGQRQRALGSFKTGNMRVLVATDIAARGIDVDGISHVVNYDLPNVPETYVHRIGRTARAGAEGIAVSICVPEEYIYLRDIERLTSRSLDLMPGADPDTDPRATFSSRNLTAPKRNGGGGNRQGRNGGGGQGRNGGGGQGRNGAPGAGRFADGGRGEGGRGDGGRGEGGRAERPGGGRSKPFRGGAGRSSGRPSGGSSRHGAAD